MSNPVSQDYMKEALEQVRQALGGELPEPHTPAFEQALRRIQRERPDLLDVLKSLQDPQALPPTNATHQANLRDFTGAARRAQPLVRNQGPPAGQGAFQLPPDGPGHRRGGVFGGAGVGGLARPQPRFVQPGLLERKHQLHLLQLEPGGSIQPVQRQSRSRSARRR